MEDERRAMYLHYRTYETKMGLMPLLLLRASYREGKRTRQLTLANLTNWSQSRALWLSGLLRMQRLPEHKNMTGAINAIILQALMENTPLETHSRFMWFFGLPQGRLGKRNYQRKKAS